MKTSFYYFVVVVLLVTKTTFGQDSGKNLPLVFDPQTKKYFTGASSKFTLKAGEQGGLVDRIEVSIDGGEYQKYNNAIDFKQEGKHTLKFRAINPVNNWSPVQFVEVFVDLTPPTTDAKFAEDSYFTDSTGTYVGLNSTITLRAQDDMSGLSNIEYSWNGKSYTSYSKPIVIEKTGKQTLHFRSFDRVGNTEVSKVLEFTSDNAAPVSELKLVGNNKTTVHNGTTFLSDGAAFSITASDDLSKIKHIWVEIDGKKQPYIKPIYILEEGKHQISYYSVDNVGNKEPGKSLAFYTVSSSPKTTVVPMGPTVNMGGINYARVGFQMKFQVQENVVGTEKTEFKMNNEGEFRPFIEPFAIATPGMYNITYRSIDRTGNAEPDKTFAVRVVDTPPDTKLSTAQPLTTRDGVTYSPAPNVVTLNVSDIAGVGVENTLVSINDGPYAPYRGPLTLDNSQKAYKISYKSVDKLGNEEETKIAILNMIRTTPVIDLFISNNQNSEEKVRTDYLEQAAEGAAKERKPAEVAPAKPAPSRPAAVVKEVVPPNVPTRLPEKKK